MAVRFTEDWQHTAGFHHHSASCEGWAWAAHVVKLRSVAGRYELTSIRKPVCEKGAEFHRNNSFPCRWRQSAKQPSIAGSHRSIVVGTRHRVHRERRNSGRPRRTGHDGRRARHRQCNLRSDRGSTAPLAHPAGRGARSPRRWTGITWRHTVLAQTAWNISFAHVKGDADGQVARIASGTAFGTGWRFEPGLTTKIVYLFRLDPSNPSLYGIASQRFLATGRANRSILLANHSIKH